MHFSLALNLKKLDAAPEDTFNRILWFSVHGEAPHRQRFVRREEY
jgi:hypothetical protein